MKKLTALFLAATLLASTVLGWPGTVAAAFKSVPSSPYVIDFDAAGTTLSSYIVETNKDRKAKFSLVKAAGVNGGQTTVLKIDGTVNPTVTTNINQNQSLAGTPDSKTNPYFAGFNIKNNRCYRYSAWLKLDESVTEKPKNAEANLVFRYNKMNADGSAGTVRKSFAEKLWSNPGQWIQVVTYFKVQFAGETGNTQRPIALSLEFNCGLNGVAFLDDIEIEEIDEIKAYGEPQEAQTITFDDDRPYEFDRVGFTVETAPPKNGTASKALKIKAGTYKKDAVVNIGTTLYNQTDPAFAVPIKNGKTYKITGWAYVAANAPDIGYAALITAYKANAASAVVRKDADFQNALNKSKGRWVQFSTTVTPQLANTAATGRLGLTFNFAKSVAADIYLDDLTVTETEPQKYYDYNNPKQQEVLTFDDNRPYEFDKPQFEIVTSPHARNGVTSKVLMVHEGLYNNNSVINQNTTLNSQTDPAFAVPVVGGRTYRLSAWLFIESTNSAGQKPAGWTEVYLYGAEADDRNDKVFTAMVNRKTGTWVKIENYITTKETTKRLGVSLNFAKNIYSNVYIDDITVEDVGAVKLHTTPQDVTEITFEDNRPYTFELPANMAIEQAPERNGEATQALRIYAGEFDYNVCLNQSTLWQGNPGTDKVFTVPVMPNTLYRFSFWVYLMKDQYFSYCEVMGDTNTTATILDLKGGGVNNIRGEWQKFEVLFLTGSDQTKLNTFFNLGKTVPDAYFDDFKFEAFLPGVYRETDLTYCEEDFNLLFRQGIDQKVNTATPGIYKLPVKGNTQYTFAVSAASTSAQDRLFLSFNGSTPMQSVVSGVPNAVITPTANRQRFGLDFVTNSSGFIYLVIENPGGTLRLENTQVFRTLSLATQLALGSNENPNLVSAPSYTPTVYDYATEAAPNTGEAPATATCCAAVLAAAALLFFRKGKREHHE